ncbi:LCP family protein [Thermorudis peleae]|uniref:LCP family protein n=1 Tax=Thermorudis peleae TaxID=1382356 RepID=UPI000690EFB1|nr:LCP family protein [Thermorudis peleae]
MADTPSGQQPEPAPLTRLTPGQVRAARQRGRNTGRATPTPVARASNGGAGAPPASSAQPVAAPAPLPARRPRWGRRIVLTLSLVAILAISAYTIRLAWAARNAFNQVFVTAVPRATVVINAQGTPELRLVTPQPGQPTPALPDWNGTQRINILLLGVDQRQGTPDEGPPRSDTIIIVSIDPVAKDVAMLSIPRDLLVTIPGFGRDKINAAYPLGATSQYTGPGLVRATIEYNFGIPIHYFAEVDFQGFIKIVDTLGGVTIDVPAPIKDDEYPGAGNNYTRIYFSTGLQHMDGATTLQYARTRHDDNDFARGLRQQQVLRALRDQAIQLNLITKAPTLLNQLADTVRTDLSPTDILALAKLGTQIDRSHIRSYTLGTAVHDYWVPGQPYYAIPDWPKIQQILNEMMPPRPGEPAPTVRAQPTQVPATPAIPEPTEAPTPTRVTSARVAPTPTPELESTPTARSLATPTPTTSSAPSRVATPTPRLATPTPRPATPTPAAAAPAQQPAILVENGTHTSGLAAQAAATLQNNGFTHVAIAQAPDAGQHPTSVIYVYGQQYTNAALQVAALLGIPPSAVYAGTPGGGGNYAIVVIIGNDFAS